MRLVTDEMRDHIHSEVSTLCTCWRLERTDGVVYTWTDHDDDIVYDGEIYLSAEHGGFDSSALVTSLGLSASNLELVGFMGKSINKAEITAGLFDAAELSVFMLNWMEPGHGTVHIRNGTLGEVRTADTNIYTVEMLGLQQQYRQIVGEVYSPECRANFCDARCGLKIEDYTAQAEVSSVTDRRHFSIDIDPTAAVAAPEGAFINGVVRFTSGLNAGKAIEIKSIDGTAITLKFTTPNLLASGDLIDISAGCDQRMSTCMQYDNIINFRGEPFVPGNNAIYKILTPTVKRDKDKDDKEYKPPKVFNPQPPPRVDDPPPLPEN